MTEDQESRVLERQKELAEGNAIRKRIWVKALGDRTFWERSLCARYYVVVSHRLQGTNIPALMHTVVYSLSVY